jgi:hypothetical protein
LEIMGLGTTSRSSASRRSLQAHLLYRIPDRWLSVCYRVSDHLEPYQSTFYYLLSLLCHFTSLRRAGPSSRGVLPSVVCLRSVIVKPRKWGGLGPQGAVEPLKKNPLYLFLVVDKNFYYLYSSTHP